MFWIKVRSTCGSLGNFSDVIEWKVKVSFWFLRNILLNNYYRVGILLCLKNVEIIKIGFFFLIRVESNVVNVGRVFYL